MEFISTKYVFVNLGAGPNSGIELPPSLKESDQIYVSQFRKKASIPPYYFTPTAGASTVYNADGCTEVEIENRNLFGELGSKTVPLTGSH